MEIAAILVFQAIVALVFQVIQASVVTAVFQAILALTESLATLERAAIQVKMEHRDTLASRAIRAIRAIRASMALKVILVSLDILE